MKSLENYAGIESNIRTCFENTDVLKFLIESKIIVFLGRDGQNMSNSCFLKTKLTQCGIEKCSFIYLFIWVICCVISDCVLNFLSLFCSAIVDFFRILIQVRKLVTSYYIGNGFWKEFFLSCFWQIFGVLKCFSDVFTILVV